MITVEISMIEANRYEEGGNHDHESYSGEWEVVEELVVSTIEGLFDVCHTCNIDCNLNKCRYIEYTPMDIVEDNEKYEIHEWKCKHMRSIGISKRNSRENLKKITPHIAIFRWNMGT